MLALGMAAISAPVPSTSPDSTNEPLGVNATVAASSADSQIPKATVVRDGSATPSPADCSSPGAVCAAGGGVTLVVTNIDRDYQPTVGAIWASAAAPKHGFHWVRVEVTWRLTSGKHDIEPSINLIDTLGEEIPLGLGGIDPRCTDGDVWGIYGPGDIVGPEPFCVQVSDPVAGPLAVDWLGGPAGAISLP